MRWRERRKGIEVERRRGKGREVSERWREGRRARVNI